MTITRIAFTQLRHTGTLTYDIPSVIASSAREVLVLVSVTVGNSGPDHCTHHLKIYTEQDQRQYEKYVFFLFHIARMLGTPTLRTCGFQ